MINYNKLAMIAFTSILLTGCAKDKAYETEDKREVSDKLQLCQPGTKYLYLPSTLGTPRKVKEANPFYQGDEKIVGCSFTKDGILIQELETDARFAENDLNQTPVMLIPGEYLDYKCAEDSYGDCSNEEEEDEDKTWDQKNFFKADYADLEVKEINMLDLANIDGDSCVTPAGVKHISTTAEKGVLNIEIEKTYKLNNSWECIRDNYFNDNLSSNSFKVRFFYSMVALDQLASKDYVVKSYPKNDHSMFGFFKNETSKLNGDFDTSRKEVTYTANRWNPNKKVLTYYLSKSYNLPRNASLLKATYASLKIMNKNLKEAGASFRLNFVQQTENDNISSGDLRYNSLVLIDDPLANGLLGYAPSVSNPETGEIVQGHVNMYGGVLKSGARWAYQGAIDIMKEQKAAKDKTQNVLTDITITNEALTSDFMPESIIAKITGNAPTQANSKVVNAHAMRMKLHFDQEVTGSEFRKVERTMLGKHNNRLKKALHTTEDSSRALDNMMNGNTEGLNALEKVARLQDIKAKKGHLASKHAVEFFEIAGTVKAVFPALLDIENVLNSDGILKNWDMLTESQKDEVKDIILVNRYTTTLVHEFGHNLGLRHNFAGSTDADNFYTKEEARELDMANIPAYSSIMDYGASEYNELAAFGKYDVAALQYAYANKVSLQNGSKLSIGNGEKTLRTLKAENDQQISANIFKAAKAIGVAGKDAAEVIEKMKDELKVLEAQASRTAADQELIASYKSVLGLEGLKTTDFKFCTDDNAGLSATCNRFDEGTNLKEIADFRINKYKTYYQYRNFRNDRNEFSSNDFDSYIVARFREFGKMRDIIEQYETYVGFFGKELMENGCSPAQVAMYPVCKDINATRDGALAIGNAFIEVLKTPDHTCAIADSSDEKTVVKLLKLADVYEEIKNTIDSNAVITTCFDENVAKYVEDELPGKVVIGQVGKFLNDLRDTNGKYEYRTDIAVRGMWADKVMAMNGLLQRDNSSSGTDDTHMALVDIPAIGAQYANLMQHMVLGKALANPIAFTKENGDTFVVPYVLSSDEKINKLESHLGGIGNFLGMKGNGDANLLETILHQVRHAGNGFTGEEADTAFAVNNFVTINRYSGYHDRTRDEDTFFYNNGRVVYQAKDENVLAYFMMDVKETKAKFDTIGKTAIEKVFALRTNPSAPVTYTAQEKLFFALPVDYTSQFVQLAKDGTELPESVFMNIFGADGAELFKLYSAALVDKGARLQEIVAQKIVIAQTPVSDATEDEKKLYDESLEMMAEYINGSMSEDVLEFYAKQFEKLPTKIEYRNY